jgi:tetratricopeptide (TPR) repeat protein
LAESGAHVLIWGTVLRNGSLTLPKLHWTASRELPVESRSRRYTLTDELEFSDVFRSDLTEILDLLVLLAGAYFSPEKAPNRGPLPDFLRRIHKLLQKEGAQWPPATLENFKFGFADLCFIHGVQDWKNDEWMQMAQDAYESAIPKDDMAWLYHRYLNAFYNLAQVYHYRGVVLENRELTEKALGLLRRIAGFTAATDYPEDRWLHVASHTQLGLVLTLLGKKDDDTAKLAEAVSAFRMVAGEHTPDFRRQIIVGLAGALRLLGEREPGVARLKEAIAPYEAAILEAPDDDARKTLTETLHGIQAQILARSESAEEAPGASPGEGD